MSDFIREISKNEKIKQAVTDLLICFCDEVHGNVILQRFLDEVIENE